MVRNHGIRPALKYMVTITNRYQNLRAHIFSWVNINPKNADPMTVPRVPKTVLASVTNAAFKRPGS